jgi:hypothetical protein
MKFVQLALIVVFLALGCGGSCPEPEAVAPPSKASEEAAIEEELEPEPTSAADTVGAEEEVAETKKRAPSAEPNFPANATVDEAIAAVPQGSERLNVDRDVLAEPLQNPDVYAPCNPGTQHFTFKVAVWNGRAVGVDVKVKDAKLATCLESRLREVEWKTKVRSLETIEYGF